MGESSEMKYDTVIIGAGMAGLTAAVYAARKRMKYALIGAEFGGELQISGEILNYPGIVKTTGAELQNTMIEQAKYNNIEVIEEKVGKIEGKDNSFIVHTDKNKYETSTVIIATGSKPKKLNVPGEDKYARKGVTYCSICDGPLFYGQDVAVIGGGDAALEAADFMKDIASKIYLIVKDEGFTAHEYLQENVRNNPKIEVIFNANTKEITGKEMVNNLTYVQDGVEKEIIVKGVVIEVGRTPNTEAFKGFVDLDEHKHILINCRTETSVPGVFAAGDCASGHEYQYVIAAGQGCMALIKAARYLAKTKR